MRVQRLPEAIAQPIGHRAEQGIYQRLSFCRYGLRQVYLNLAIIPFELGQYLFEWMASIISADGYFIRAVGAIVQVVKQRTAAGLSIQRRIVQGTQQIVQNLLERTQNGGVINTAYIERLNATFRQRLVWLCRRTRYLAQ